MTTSNGSCGPRPPFTFSSSAAGKAQPSTIQELPFENTPANYLHGTITRHEAERLLLASSPEEDGRFLVRVRPTSGRQYRVRILNDGSHTFLTKTLRSTKPRQDNPPSPPSHSRRTSTTSAQIRPRRSSMAQTLSDMYASATSSRRGSQQSLFSAGQDEDSGRASENADGPLMKRGSIASLGGFVHGGNSRPASGMQSLTEEEEGEQGGITPNDGSETDVDIGGGTTSPGEEGRYGSFSAPSAPGDDTIPSSTSQNFSLGPKDSLYRASVKLLNKMKDVPAGPAWMGHVHEQPRRSSTFAAMSSVAASFRRKTSKDTDAPDQYILSVVYQGRCTHHLVSREDHWKPFAVNNRMTRCKSLQSVVYMLALTKDARWPVRLQHPVAPIEDPSEVLVEGRVLYSSNNTDAALHCYDKAVATVTRLMSMFPHKEHEYEYTLAMAYDLRATALLNKRLYRRAADDAHAATTLAPEWWKPHFSEGLALREARDFDEAIAAFQQAHDLLPHGDVKVEQCVTAVRDTNALRAQAQREISKQKLTDIEIVRKNTADKDTRKRPSISFGQHISDEGIWYILRKRELCEAQRRNTLTAAPNTVTKSVGNTAAAANNEAASAGNCDRRDCVTTLCSELKQRTVCVDGTAPATQDPHENFELEAPALPDLLKEATALEKLFEERLLPTGRWRVPQQQHVTTWMQWYHLRMGQKLPEYGLEKRHEQTTDMYSWVLTTAHILRQNIFEEQSPSGSLSIHIVARKPIHEFSAVELCAMLPEMTSINVVQVIPADRVHGELKCDDVLPGDEALPAQRLRVSTISGSYSDLLNADCEHVKKPDLVLFMDSGRRADPRIQADFEDAVDFLTKRKVPIIFTQRFHERHTEVQQWLRDLQLTTASDPKGENPLCSLRAHGEKEEPLAVNRFEGQHNGYILFAPA